MSLSRRQLSLLITIFSLSIIVLMLYSISLGKDKEEADDYVVEMILAEEDIEELEEEKELLEEMAKSDPIKSHLAYNESAEASYGNPEPLQTLEELMAEQEANESSDEPTEALSDGAYGERVKELKRKREEAKQKLGELEASKEVFTNNLAARRSSVSYSLVKRSDLKLPPPIYTCIEGGKVVINIEVNESGAVTSADFNQNSSGTSNGCLVDNAIAYAYKSKFTASSKNSQKGTITYLFEGKSR